MIPSLSVILLSILNLPCYALSLGGSKTSFLNSQKSENVLEPSVIDGEFLQSVINTPGDALILLYSPTCPDCQWFIPKVWRNVVARLSQDPNVSVMTVADPGYAAPKPFDHWNNPAIFFAPKDDKLNPICFPQTRLGEYLKGLPLKLRSQEQQDSDLLQDVLTFARGAQGVRLLQQPMVPIQGQSLKDVENLADQEWIALQKKWAGAKDYPAPPSATVMPKGAKFPKTTLMVSSQTVRDASSQQLHAEQLDPDQLWVLSMSQQSAKLERAEAWAMEYAQKFLLDHPGQGYTAEGVFKYALPYYRGLAHDTKS